MRTDNLTRKQKLVMALILIREIKNDKRQLEEREEELRRDFPAETLKAMRLNHDLSQSEVARATGVSDSLVSKVESGGLPPTPEYLEPFIRFILGLEDGRLCSMCREPMTKDDLIADDITCSGCRYDAQETEAWGETLEYYEDER